MSLSIVTAREGLTSQRKYFENMFVAHCDAHGASLLAVKIRQAKRMGLNYVAVSRYPDTMPTTWAETLRRLIREYDAKRIDLLDLPINVQRPQECLNSIVEAIRSGAMVVYIDHHDTDKQYIFELQANGAIVLFSDTATGLIPYLLRPDSDNVEYETLIVGCVADRDKSVTQLVSRREIESKYLRLANRLDVAVRNPRLLQCETVADVAELIAERGLEALPESLDQHYEPYRLWREFDIKVIQEGVISVVVDLTEISPNVSMWIPKTLEQLLIARNRDIAIAICDAFDPKTQRRVATDIRILRYWLSQNEANLVQTLIESTRRCGIQIDRRNIVGHGDYVSLRVSDKEVATRIAYEVYREIERHESASAHLVSEASLAVAVSRDYRRIIELLERIATALERGAEAKERQVELLQELYERDRRTRYD